MLKKIVSLGLIGTMLFPCVALARHHAPPPRPRYVRHHNHHRHYHRHSRSWHRGDYAAVAAGVLIGVILSR